MLLVIIGFNISAQQVTGSLPAVTQIHEKNDSKKLLSNAMPSKGKIMIIFYDPGCGSCQQLGSDVNKNIASLKNTSVFFISMHDADLVDGYINMYAKELKNQKNVSFWKDPGVEFIEKFAPTNYPATYIYEASTKKLLKSFQGEGRIKDMLPFLN